MQGVPRFFSPLDRALLRGFQTFGGWLPGVAVPLVKEHMQHETANVVLPAETDLLRDHLRARQADGVRMNLNFLGETVLGEEEAAAPAGKISGGAAASRGRGGLGQDFHALLADLAAGPRAQTLRVLCDRLGIALSQAARLPFLPGGRRERFRSSSTWTWRNTATCT